MQSLDGKWFHYQILGVRKDCSKTEITKAYKKLIMEHHPDKHSKESKEK